MIVALEAHFPVGVEILEKEVNVMFYIYENWRARGHKAVIHRGNCDSCNDGTGVTTGTRPDNGRWLGPFHNEPDAEAAAQATGGRLIRHNCV